MQRLTVNASGQYDIHIGNGLLQGAGELLSPLLPSKRVMVVSDDNVFPLWGDTLLRSLHSAGFSAECFIFPAGETSKNTETYLSLLRLLSEKGFTRADGIAALGGGVTGDLAGFAAATYLRGVRYVQLPTTVLAAVDSSVGGKTAVDLPTGKNLVGAFYQPKAVITDLDCFSTLPGKIYRDGFAEVIKCGILEGETLFSLLENFLSGREDAPDKKPARLEEIVTRCVALKRDIVQRDEFDKGERALLNLGHTLGHAVERESGYGISHGEAVAVGTAAVAAAAAAAGICPEADAARIRKTLEAYGFSTAIPYPLPTLVHAMTADKKRAGDKITLIVPAGIGDCRMIPLPTAELLSFFEGKGSALQDENP